MPWLYVHHSSLFYGHNVKSQDVSVAAHVLQIKEQLQKMSDLVNQNMMKLQADQKKWYDRNARSHKFQPGE